MKISSVGAYNVHCSYQKSKNVKKNVSFEGKHTFAKGLAGTCGVLGTLGAVGGMLIMTGGLGAAALPWIAGYGLTSAGAGAVLGHEIDKGGKSDDEEDN